MKRYKCKLSLYLKEVVSMNLPNPWGIGIKLGNKLHLKHSCPNNNDGVNCTAK